MKTKERPYSVALALGAALVLLTACSNDSGQQGDGAQGSEGGGDSSTDELIVALPADPQNIYGHATTNQRDLNLAEAVNEKLIEFAPEADGFEGRLAESWEQVSDTAVELKLREGVKFTNGEDFSAESAKYSIERMMESEALATFTATVTGVEIVDDYTIRVTSDSPTTLLLTSLALGSYQFPMELHQEMGIEAFSEEPVGTGPYLFAEWNKGSSLRYEANPEYWNGPADFEVLNFQVIPDFDAQVAALESGQVHFVASLPIDAVSRVENSSVATLTSRPSNRIYYVTFNTLADTPLQDPQVRQALQYAVDVEDIIATALGGHGTALQGQIITPAFGGFDPSLEAKGYDPELAKEMLAEAGYPDGFSIPLQYSQTNLPPVGELLAQQLAEVGVTAEQELMESGAFLTALTAKELSGIFYAGSLPPPDAAFMYTQFASDFRYSYYANPTIDDLLVKQQSTADPDERADFLAQMMAEFEEDPAFIPLFQGEDQYGVANNVKGFVPRASQWIDWHELSNG